MASRPLSPPRRPRACMPCTRVKARCHFKAENITRHVCDRCEKMGIECSAKTTKSLRRSRAIRNASSVATLQHEIAITSRSEASQAGDEITSISESPIQLDSTRIKRSAQANSASSATQRPPNSLSIPQSTSNTASSLPFGLTWDQASQILGIFRDQYMINFPFVHINSDTTSQLLYVEKPCLFRTVMLVAAPVSEPRIEKMKRNVLAYLGHQVLVEEARELEILQGLLVAIAWAHMCHIRDEQVTNLSHLALGYAHNLGLTKVPAVLLEKVDPKSTSQDMLDKSRAMDKEKTHSVEEQGVLLGLYCLLSVNSIQHMRRNPLDSTYIEMCCKALAENHSPSHLLLERMVRLTQMSENLSLAFGESHERSHAKPYAYLLEGSGRSFRTDVNRIIEMAMHPDLQKHHKLFKLWQNYLFVRLYEPATRIKELENKGIGPSMYRSLCLRNCFQAIKDYFEILLSDSSTTDIGFQTLLTSEQSAYVMLLTARLLLIQAPDWDVDSARKQLDFAFLLDRIIQRLEGADLSQKQATKAFAKETGLTVTEEEFKVESRLTETAKKTRWLKEGFQARLEGRAPECNELIASREPSTGAHQREQEPAVRWVNGMLAGAAWNFDGFATGFMLSQDSVSL